jgi:uncharacterized membrane protein YheB (UPF0754 family)
MDFLNYIDLDNDLELYGKVPMEINLPFSTYVDENHSDKEMFFDKKKLSKEFYSILSRNMTNDTKYFIDISVGDVSKELAHFLKSNMLKKIVSPNITCEYGLFLMKELNCHKKNESYKIIMNGEWHLNVRESLKEVLWYAIQNNAVSHSQDKVKFSLCGESFYENIIPYVSKCDVYGVHDFVYSVACKFQGEKFSNLLKSIVKDLCVEGIVYAAVNVLSTSTDEGVIIEMTLAKTIVIPYYYESTYEKDQENFTEYSEKIEQLRCQALWYGKELDCLFEEFE